jgi:hypothetical protein
MRNRDKLPPTQVQALAAGSPSIAVLLLGLGTAVLGRALGQRSQLR